MNSKTYHPSVNLNSRNIFSILRWISLILIFGSILLLVLQLVQYSRLRNTYPPGMVIGGVSVGGLTSSEAASRLIQSYGLPVEIRYLDSAIQIKPAVAGFELDISTMLAAAELQRINQPFWNAFWDYLWNRLPEPSEIPLRASISEARLRNYLEDEIAMRYDKPPSTIVPKAGDVVFESGDSGTQLDVNRAIVLIENALKSPTKRVVNLSYSRIDPLRPSFENLQIMLKQIIDVSEFAGISEVYLYDLQSSQELSFAYQLGEPVQPGISFTAASTMKIPIMLSVYRRIQPPYSAEITDLLQLMIERSENGPADELMERLLETNLGPLMVTDDLLSLGLNNTFLAGYFYPGAPLLKKIETPASQRSDIVIDQDDYNQTTPIEMGMLLRDIYTCSKSGGGTFAAVFPGELTQTECADMISYLMMNKIGVLIQAGLPDGTQFAHKHGWITESDGLIHTIGDAGIVYSPSTTYILTIFLYDDNQLVWDKANLLMAQLSTAIYNYFNLPTS